jgi:uncharacterized peroxidase-related enzyme
MSRISALEPAQATGATKDLLAQAKAALGATPNMTRVMAHSTALQAYLSLNATVSQGSISAATGERIGLGVAQSNGCGYCLSAHTFLGKNVAKLPQDELDSGRHFASSDPKAAAILAFASAVLAGKGEVSDHDFSAARNAGLDDAELGDTVVWVAFNLLTNYFNKAFQVDIDFPVVTLS